jgi:serine/threonine-protein kinase
VQEDGTFGSPSEASSALLFREGELVGGTFEVRRLLGQGGMAQVWEAHDRDLVRRVALKAARPRPPAPPLRKEAQALAAFRHPSLVTVHGLGEHEGVDYIVLERIFGVSLEEKLNRRRAGGAQLPVSEALDLALAIAEGLAVVHRAGLAHCDVKPGNVMLTPDGRVVLMDFGLVLAEHEVEMRGVIAGSPPYMAPELFSDDVVKGAGQLVDIYALGATAFELLTLRTPFDECTSLQELAECHRSRAVPPLDEHRSDGVVLPAELEQLIRDMLAKRPLDRPPSAEAVAWQLRSIADAWVDRGGEDARRKSLPPIEGAVDVLVVEDDPAIARVLRFYLGEIFGRDQVCVRHAVDGEEAMGALRDRDPDLLLLDLHLPKMNGVEVGMQLRGEGLATRTKIVAVSAGAQEHDLQLLHLLGCHHFVPKGPDMKERLATAVRALFRSRFTPTPRRSD